MQGLDVLPAWRITCFFVDRRYRRRGVSSAALNGALAEVARLGGGTVESYPEEVGARSVSSSFLHNGTVAMFERYGFKRVRRLGKNHWVVEKTVAGRPERADIARGYGRGPDRGRARGLG
jgi:GNAT superfamily N-acetyltransferase